MNNYKYGIHIHTDTYIFELLHDKYTRIHTDTHTIYTYGTEQYVILLWRTGNKKIIQVPESIPRKLFLRSFYRLWFFCFFFFLFILETGVHLHIIANKSPRDP